MKAAISTREKFGAGVRDSFFSADASSSTDLMRVATWGPMRLGRVLPIMIPIFLGERAAAGAWDMVKNGEGESMGCGYSVVKYQI